MAEPSERDAALLLDIKLAAEDALSFVGGLSETEFLASRLHQYAVIRSLEIIGEAAGKVSAEYRASRADIPWREMAGMRHRLIHGYAEVRVDLVWSVVQSRLPPLLESLTGQIKPS
jgi:uncharacterized protein with HEPN domain